ncbi:MAG: aldo/keto reductase [Akkermansia sp.]|nr:aldo/keto reductase [Akkermansia sp.]MCC8149295.1 aldo/keto reductase [Akkermansia sp.]
MMEHSVTFPDHRQVCSLGQGTWKMGKSALREAEEINALRAGIELGMSAVDTAEMYGNEELVGKAICGLRDRVFLITKVLPGNASRTGTKAACERSLKKLQTDCVDLYLLHWGGPHPIEDTVASMIELQQEGKIKSWGVSNMDVAEMERFYAVPGGNSCAANQILYNLAHRGVEYDLLPWCRERHIPVIAYSPADEGRLSGNPVLVEIARKHEATPVQIALAWILRLPGMIAIPKAGSVMHVQENYRSLSINLTAGDLELLDEAFPPPGRKVHLDSW